MPSGGLAQWQLYDKYNRIVAVGNKKKGQGNICDRQLK